MNATTSENLLQRTPGTHRAALGRRRHGRAAGSAAAAVEGAAPAVDVGVLTHRDRRRCPGDGGAAAGTDRRPRRGSAVRVPGPAASAEPPRRARGADRRGGVVAHVAGAALLVATAASGVLAFTGSAHVVAELGVFVLVYAVGVGVPPWVSGPAAPVPPSCWRPRSDEHARPVTHRRRMGHRDRRRRRALVDRGARPAGGAAAGLPGGPAVVRPARRRTAGHRARTARSRRPPRVGGGGAGVGGAQQPGRAPGRGDAHRGGRATHRGDRGRPGRPRPARAPGGAPEPGGRRGAAWARTSGGPAVTAEVDGEPATEPGEADRFAHRIVVALTNVLRHAGPSATRLVCGTGRARWSSRCATAACCPGTGPWRTAPGWGW